MKPAVLNVFQAMSSVKEGEDTLSKLGGALHFVPEDVQKGDLAQLVSSAAGVAADSSEGAATESLAASSLPQVTGQDGGETVDAPTSAAIELASSEPSCKSAGELLGHQGSGLCVNGAKESKSQLSELMASCVATLLLVQVLSRS